MSVTVLNLEGLPKPVTYRQVAVATGSRTVFVATALEAVGGTFDHVARLTAYVVRLQEADMAALAHARRRPRSTFQYHAEFVPEALNFLAA